MLNSPNNENLVAKRQGFFIRAVDDLILICFYCLKIKGTNCDK